MPMPMIQLRNPLELLSYGIGISTFPDEYFIFAVPHLLSESLLISFVDFKAI